ncbi:MAG: VWA domain-containing protein [Dehalococcoidia bacterium]
MRKLTKRANGEDGQILMLTALMITVLLGMVALVVDVGLFLHGRQDVQNVVDAAALAGAQELPANTALADSLARQYAVSNDADTSADVSFRCVIGDRNNDRLPDLEDIPYACDPGSDGRFHCGYERCVSLCFPSQGDSCNTIYVGGSKVVPFSFAPIIGVMNENTGEIHAAACKGTCGGDSAPLDLVMVIDRTGSMSGAKLANAKNAAKAVLELYDPNTQHVGLAVLGPGLGGNPCAVADDSPNGNWLVVPLSADYQNSNGTLNTSSRLVQTINCLQADKFTNFGDPLKAAANHLLNSGRPGVKKGIIFLTDGMANRPTSQRNPCSYGRTTADTAKASDIEIFTIGFAVAGERCQVDRDAPYANTLVTQPLADMATDSLDDHGRCSSSANTRAENEDGDHFLCEAATGDLEPIFRHAAEILAGGPRLIRLP